MKDIFFLSILLLVFLSSLALADTAPPEISFIHPTPDNQETISEDNFLVNISIQEENLAKVTYNWDGINYSLYDESLVLMMNFDNRDELGENSTFIKDLSIYGNDGTCSGTSCPTWTSEGKDGGAFNFDGSNDHIYSNDPGVDGNGFTLSAWVKLDKLSPAQIINRWDENGNNRVWSLAITNDNWRFDTSNTGSWQGGNHVFTSAVGDVNHWIFITAVYDETSNHIFRNGVLMASKDRSDNGIYSGSSIPMRIGYSPRFGGSAIYINGLIDEVRIWNRSLSEKEIQTIYMSSLRKFNETHWYLYVNQTNNATNGLDDGIYTYQAFAKDSSEQYNQTEMREITIDYDYVPTVTYSNFASDPETTNFSEVDSSNVDNPILAKDDAKVEWSATGMNLAGADLDSNVIFAHNFVSVNSTALPVLNAPANITFRTTSYSAGINSFNVLKDGVLCSPPECIKHSASPVLFEVQGFSNYTTQGTGEIPEFNLFTIILGLSILTIAIIITRKRQ